MSEYPAPITYVGEVKPNSTDPKASGFYDQLNQSQFDALQKWKAELKEGNVIDNFEIYDDLFLLRFLRARKFDLEKTMEMFKKFLQWRIDMKVDEIRETYEIENLIQIKSLNIKIKEIYWLYLYLNNYKDEDFENEVKEYKDSKEKINETVEVEEPPKTPKNIFGGNDISDDDEKDDNYEDDD